VWVQSKDVSAGLHTIHMHLHPATVAKGETYHRANLYKQSKIYSADCNTDSHFAAITFFYREIDDLIHAQAPILILFIGISKLVLFSHEL
jgi:hypothetical protein